MNINNIVVNSLNSVVLVANTVQNNTKASELTENNCAILTFETDSDIPGTLHLSQIQSVCSVISACSGVR